MAGLVSPLVCPGLRVVLMDMTSCFSFSPTGQRTLHHSSDVLETVVLVNPSEDTVISEVLKNLPLCWLYSEHLL